MKLHASLLAFACLLLTSSPSFPQDARGRIVGRVLDTSGAAVPAVEVKATNLATNVTVSTVSNDAGNYEIPYLLPGSYQLTAAQPGFKTYQRAGLDLRVGDRLQIDIQLEIGELAETVTITAETPLLEAGNATMGQVVDERRILELPLPGGNAFTLARLTPGVVNLATPNHPSLGPAVEVASNFSVNGTRSGNTEFSIDGSPAMWGANSAYIPPADMVSEFKVQTATYDASQGRSAGANVNIALRSGTNRFRGSLYEFHNNNKLQGLDLFQRQFLYNPATGPVNDAKRKEVAPQHVINRFGFTFGGPVYLPKVYDGRNRTFWIHGFEGLTRPGTERGGYFKTVPTAAQRGGDFSALLALGPAFQIYDPASIQPAPGGRFSRQPLPGNIVPASRLDPAAVRMLEYWPQSNTAGAADGRNNYFRPNQSLNEFFSNTTRVDHNFSERHRVFFRYNQTYQLFASAQVFDNIATGQDRKRYNKGFGFDDVFILSPNFLVNFRYGFSRFLQTFDPRAQGIDLAGLGFTPNLVNRIDPQGVTFPQIAIEGMQALGTQYPRATASNYHTWSLDFSRTMGAHSVRFGGDFRLYREHNSDFSYATPRIEFGNTWTRGPLDSSPAAPIGQGTASFLFGIPTGGRIDVRDSLAEQSSTAGLYVHDDWRATSKLTLNMGLRWDYDAPITERFNRTVGGFDLTAANPIEAAARANYALNPIPELPAAQFRTPGGLTFAGVGGNPRELWRSPRVNLSPRIGFAYSLKPTTVIRAGYGIFFVPFGADRESVNQSGFSIQNNLVSSLDNGQNFIASLANPFPTGFAMPPGASGGLSTDVGRAVSFFNRTPKNGYMQRWSFGLQHELPGRVVLDATYVGNRGTRLATSRPLNEIPNEYLSRSPERDQQTINFLTQQVRNPFYPMLPGTNIAGQNVQRLQLLRPMPHFTGVSMVNDPIGYSWYHSAQTRVERRFASGMTISFNHTWSKFMEAVGFLNNSIPQLEHAISPQDRTHRVAASGMYELPFGPRKPILSNSRGLLAHLVGGWQVSAVWQANTGAPLGFGNVILLDSPDKIALPKSERTFDRWFNTAVFDRRAAAQLAQNVRTVSSRYSGVRQPGINIWDVSALKHFQIRENMRLQLRAEFLNAFNRSHFAAPNTAPTNAQFGTITSATGVPRQIYFATKLMF